MTGVISRLIVRTAWLNLVLGLMVTAFSAHWIRDLRVEHSQAQYMPPDSDPVMEQYRRFKHQFGDRAVLVAGIDYGERMTAGDIRHLLGLSREIESIEGVENVWSLANAPRAIWEPFRPRFVNALTGDEPDSLLEVKVHDRLAQERLLQGNLISPDGHWAGMVIDIGIPESGSREAGRVALAGTIQGRLEEVCGNRCRVVLTGLPLVSQAIKASTQRDLRVFGILSLGLLVILLIILFGHAAPVVLGLAASAMSLTLSLALLPLTGTPLSAGLTIMVAVVPVISLAFSTHFLVHFLEGPSDVTAQQRFHRMMAAAFTPSLLCGATTTVGFASLALSPLAAIRELGTFMALAVLIAMVASSYFLPSWLWLLACSRLRFRPPTRFPARVAEILGGYALDHPRAVLLAGGFVAIGLGAGVLRLTVDANPIGFFQADAEIRRAYESVDANLGGSVPLEVTIRRRIGTTDGLAGSMLRAEERLRRIEGVGWVGSSLDVLLMAEKGRPKMASPLLDLKSGRIAEYAWRSLIESPSTRGLVFADSTHTVFRLAGRLHVGGSNNLRRLLDQYSEVIKEELAGNDVSLAGQAVMLLRTHDYLVSSLVKGFAVAFLIILGLLALLSRDPKTAGATVLANLFPLLAVLGTMGWLGISIDTSTAMIASIALGIIVDDTVHLIHRFRRSRAEEKTILGSLRRTIMAVGAPILITTIVFAGGFLILAPSSFVPTSHFGLLSSLTMIIAFLADLMVLPAFLVLLGGSPRSRRAGQA